MLNLDRTFIEIKDSYYYNYYFINAIQFRKQQIKVSRMIFFKLPFKFNSFLMCLNLLVFPQSSVLRVFACCATQREKWSHRHISISHFSLCRQKKKLHPQLSNTKAASRSQSLSERRADRLCVRVCVHLCVSVSVCAWAPVGPPWRPKPPASSTANAAKVGRLFCVCVCRPAAPDGL